jgi:hypothetical protein
MPYSRRKTRKFALGGSKSYCESGNIRADLFSQKHAVMTTKPSEQPLFRSLSADGKPVMLSVTDDGTWTIRHDGEVVADGKGDQISIDAAVRKFRALVKPREK